MVMSVKGHFISVLGEAMHYLIALTNGSRSKVVGSIKLFDYRRRGLHVAIKSVYGTIDVLHNSAN